jgi:hypothetical protein
MRQAKKDKKRTKLVRDTLYIDGEVYTAPVESAPARPVSTPVQKTPQAPSRHTKRQRVGSTPETTR